jgi:hypothetical protein
MDGGPAEAAARWAATRSLTPPDPHPACGGIGGCSAHDGASSRPITIALYGKTLLKIGTTDYWKITLFPVHSIVRLKGCFNLRRRGRFLPVSNGGFRT